MSLAVHGLRKTTPKNNRRAHIKVCNLCQQTYLSRSKFDRFCLGCKESSELYHFHEWLSA